MNVYLIFVIGVVVLIMATRIATFGFKARVLYNQPHSGLARGLEQTSQSRQRRMFFKFQVSIKTWPRKLPHGGEGKAD